MTVNTAIALLNTDDGWGLAAEDPGDRLIRGGVAACKYFEEK